ncbi:MAG: lysophospholipid acyltransferase family protein [Brevinematia bacterium]
MIFNIFYAIYFVIVMVSLSIFIMIIYPFFMIFRAKKAWEKFFTYFVSLWARLEIAGTGTKVTVKGIEKLPESNVVFISNHQGYFDIPLILGYTRRLVGFIAKIELKKIPLLSFWMKRIHCVFIDRKNLRKANEYIDEGVKNLLNGYNMLIFPEGTRSKSNKTLPFKVGSFKLALRSSVPIVPLTIKNTYKMLEETGKIKKANVELIIHDPVYPQTYSEIDKNELVKKVEETIKKPLEE